MSSNYKYLVGGHSRRERALTFNVKSPTWPHALGTGDCVEVTNVVDWPYVADGVESCALEVLLKKPGTDTVDVLKAVDGIVVKVRFSVGRDTMAELLQKVL